MRRNFILADDEEGNAGDNYNTNKLDNASAFILKVNRVYRELNPDSTPVNLRVLASDGARNPLDFQEEQAQLNNLNSHAGVLIAGATGGASTQSTNLSNPISYPQTQPPLNVNIQNNINGVNQIGIQSSNANQTINLNIEGNTNTVNYINIGEVPAIISSINNIDMINTGGASSGLEGGAPAALEETSNVLEGGASARQSLSMTTNILMVLNIAHCAYSMYKEGEELVDLLGAMEGF